MPKLNLSLGLPTTKISAPVDTSILKLKFDGNFNDSSPEGVPMETTGSPVISTSIKKYGSGAVSMASGRVRSTGYYIPDLSASDWTIEGWVYRPTNYTANRQGIVNLASEENPFAPPRVMFYWVGVNIYYFEAEGGLVANNGAAADASGGTIPVGAWTHFAVTWSAVDEEKTIFIDGAIVSTGGQPAIPGPYTANIGNMSVYWAGESFASDIYFDNIRITPSLVYDGEFSGNLPGDY